MYSVIGLVDIVNILFKSGHLPDARDGLKPVQRRILYAMHVEGNTHEKGFENLLKQSVMSLVITIHMGILPYMKQWYG